MMSIMWPLALLPSTHEYEDKDEKLSQSASKSVLNQNAWVIYSL